MRYVFLMLTLTALTGSLAPTASAQADTTAAPPSRPGGRWVAHLGAGSLHAWNFVGLTREWRRGRFRPFVTGGLGTILIGAGAAYYTNPDGSGLVLSATAGIAGAHATAALDLRLSQRWGLVLGGSYGTYFLQYRGLLPVAALQVRL